MKTRIRRRALPLAAAAFLIALFAVPSVRAAAVDILGLFRVQQVEVVAFNPANLPANLESSLRNYEPLLSNQVAFSGGGEAIRVATPEEASEMAGFPVRIPVGVDNFLLTVQPAAQAVITVDVDVWQALLDEVGRSDLVLPAGLDGEAITIRLPSSVTFVSGDCALATPESGGPRAHQIDCLVVVQMPSPEVEAPAGLPVDELGRIFVEFLGLSPEEAERFSREIDWTTTLVIPVPNTARYQEAVVNGATAFRFSNTFESGVANHSLIWVEGEIVYSLMLNGDYRANEALAIARGLR